MTGTALPNDARMTAIRFRKALLVPFLVAHTSARILAASSVCVFTPSAFAGAYSADLSLHSSTPDPAAASSQPAVSPDNCDTAPSFRLESNTWIWMMGVKGTVGGRRLQLDVDASFGDILEASDSVFAFSGRLELGYGRFGAYIDGVYADLGVDDVSGPAGFASIDVSLQQAILDFGAMYRLGDWKPTGDAGLNPRDLTLDLYAGGRYSGLDLEFDLNNLPSRSASEDWVDPVIGLKLALPLSERWHAKVNGDIGGFGAASDFTWSATGVFGYDFHVFRTPATFMFGYRAIGWDYSTGEGDGRFVWDVIVHGPIIGLDFRF